MKLIRTATLHSASYPFMADCHCGTDLFELRGQSYPLIIDYYSSYIELAFLTQTTSTSVINSLESIFARHRLPEKLISDNGLQYASDVFAKFSKARV